MAQGFRDLKVWQASKQLALLVYRLTSSFPRCELHGITRQMRAAAVSIPANIAEGQGRGTRKDYCHFVGMALGSPNELVTLAEIARDLGYGEPTRWQRVFEEMDEVRRMLHGLRNSLSRRGQAPRSGAQPET